MSVYYNENDKHAAAWLRQLIKNGLIADGYVDDRSIIDVKPEDLKGFNQCHFFAGIGGWSLALRIAGVPDNYPVWTGSCPCQPFSVAGKNNGKSDKRHLWPEFYRLIKESRPITIFGEQVEGAIKHGWLDDLCSDLEAENYTTGAVVLGAHSAGAFHQRQRLFWVAYSNVEQTNTTDKKGFYAEPSGGSSVGNIEHARQFTRQITSSNVLSGAEWRQEKQIVSSEFERAGEARNAGMLSASQNRCAIWDNPEWIYCQDNKYRPVKPSIQPLANGLPKGMVYSSDSSIAPDETQEARVMRLKGYGNAIVPQIAAEFIRAFYEYH